jgi:hypothetical protein
MLLKAGKSSKVWEMMPIWRNITEEQLQEMAVENLMDILDYV